MSYIRRNRTRDRELREVMEHNNGVENDAQQQHDDVEMDASDNSDSNGHTQDLLGRSTVHYTGCEVAVEIDDYDFFEHDSGQEDEGGKYCGRESTEVEQSLTTDSDHHQRCLGDGGHEAQERVERLEAQEGVEVERLETQERVERLENLTARQSLPGGTYHHYPVRLHGRKCSECPVSHQNVVDFLKSIQKLDGNEERPFPLKVRIYEQATIIILEVSTLSEAEDWIKLIRIKKESCLTENSCPDWLDANTLKGTHEDYRKVGHTFRGDKRKLKKRKSDSAVDCK